MKETQECSENVPGFAGLDYLMKWAEGGQGTGGEQTQSVLRALCSEVRWLRSVVERQASSIRHLRVTIEEYEEQAIGDGRF